MLVGVSNVDTEQQVGFDDELITGSTLDAAIGFPLGQTAGWGLAKGHAGVGSFISVIVAWLFVPAS